VAATVAVIRMAVIRMAVTVAVIRMAMTVAMTVAATVAVRVAATATWVTSHRSLFEWLITGL
jgi:hypothetical protein